MSEHSPYSGAKFVFGGNSEEARRCLRELNLNPRDVAILTRPEQLIGARGPKVIVCGNYYLRRDYLQFLEAFNRWEAFTKYYAPQGNF